MSLKCLKYVNQIEQYKFPDNLFSTALQNEPRIRPHFNIINQFDIGMKNRSNGGGSGGGLVGKFSMRRSSQQLQLSSSINSIHGLGGVGLTGNKISTEFKARSLIAQAAAVQGQSNSGLISQPAAECALPQSQKINLMPKMLHPIDESGSSFALDSRNNSPDIERSDASTNKNQSHASRRQENTNSKRSTCLSRIQKCISKSANSNGAESHQGKQSGGSSGQSHRNSNSSSGSNPVTHQYRKSVSANMSGASPGSWFLEALENINKDELIEYLKGRRIFFLVFNVFLQIYSLIVIGLELRLIILHSSDEEEVQELWRQNESPSSKQSRYQAKNIPLSHNDNMAFSLISNPTPTKQITFLSVQSVILLVHIAITILQYRKHSILMKLYKANAYMALFLVAAMTHLQVVQDIYLITLSIGGVYIVMPLALFAMAEHFAQVILAFLVLQIYPNVYLDYFTRKLHISADGFGSDLAFGQSIHTFYVVVPLALFHLCGFAFLLWHVINLREEITVERRNVEIVKSEYDDILEKMPEGILIINNEGAIEFMNIELREVLNLQFSLKASEDQRGLQVKMFKKYNLVEELSQPQQDQQDGSEQPQTADSLNELINMGDWREDEDRFYELEMPGQVPEKDEDRIFTQIRKTQVEFHEKHATLLLIRNITHIINYEKAKNVGKYQELLTGTMSHEMLTPLNTIINISQFIEMKIQQQLDTIFTVKDEQLQLILMTKQHMQDCLNKKNIHAQKNKNEDEEEEEEESSSSSELTESPMDSSPSPGVQGQGLGNNGFQHQAYIHSGNNNMQGFLLSEQRKIIIQNVNSQEKSFLDQLDYLQMVKSSAVILQYLVKELIDLNNIKQGKFTPNITGHDQNAIQDACQEILDCYKIQAREKNIFLRLQRASRIFLRDFELYFDKQRYQQILINLVQNAVKFTSVGGVEIITEIDQAGVTRAILNNSTQSQFSAGVVTPFTAHQEERYKGVGSGSVQQNNASTSQTNCDHCGFIITRVKDTGVGMKKEILDKLFKLFALVQSSSKKGLITTQGIGLGLSVNKQVVEKLGGKIKIKTEPNQGTEVMFSIPYKCKQCSQGVRCIGSDLIVANVGVNPIQQSSLSRQSIYRNKTQVDFSFGNSEKKLMRERASLKSSSNIQPKKLKKAQPFGGDYQSIYGSQAQNDSQNLEENSRYLIKYQNSINGLGSENPYLESPFGIGGLPSLNFQTNIGGKSQRSRANSEESISQSENAILSQNHLQKLMKKKTNDGRNSPLKNAQNQAHRNSLAPTQMLGFDLLKHMNTSKNSKPSGMTFNQSRQFQRNYSVKETSSKRSTFAMRQSQHQMKNLDYSGTGLLGGMIFGGMRGKSCGLHPGQQKKQIEPEEISRSIRESELDGPQTEFLRFRANGRSHTAVSIQIVHPLQEHQYSTGAALLSINDEMEHSREIVPKNLLPQEKEMKKNDLKELGKTLSSINQDENQYEKSSSSSSYEDDKEISNGAIKITLQHQNIILGEKQQIIKGDLNSCICPISPAGYKDSDYLLARECCGDASTDNQNNLLSANYHTKQIKPENAPYLMQSAEESKKGILKKQTSIFKKLRFEGEEEKKEGEIQQTGEATPGAGGGGIRNQQMRKQALQSSLVNPHNLNRIADQSFPQGINGQPSSLSQILNGKDLSKEKQGSNDQKQQHQQTGSSEKFVVGTPLGTNGGGGRLNINQGKKKKASINISSNEFSSLNKQSILLCHESEDTSPMLMSHLAQQNGGGGGGLHQKQAILSSQNNKKGKQRKQHEEEKKQTKDRNLSSQNHSVNSKGVQNVVSYNHMQNKNNDLNICSCQSKVLNQQSVEESSILIVDDNLFNLIPLELILKEYNGLKCDKALNGEEAVNLFKKNLQAFNTQNQTSSNERCSVCGGKFPEKQLKLPSYRLVFMDIQMPIMDGYEATRQILTLYNKWKSSNRISDAQHNLRIIAITSFTNDEALKEALQAGMSLVLNKPVDKNQIKGTLEKYYYPQICDGGNIGAAKKSSAFSNISAYPGGF